MKTNSILLFSTTPEVEKRFVFSPEVIYKALDDGKIKIKDIVHIKQIWIVNGEKYTGRIRQIDELIPKGVTTYEHTIKYHITKDMDYEVTTELTEKDFSLIQKIFKDVPTQQKTRARVIDVSGEYEEYIITVDFPEDKKDECWVEFEHKDGKRGVKFEKPSWLKKS